MAKPKKHVIKVEYDFSEGGTRVHTEGFEGDECFREAAQLEAALGKATEVTRTGEAFKGKEQEVVIHH